MADLVIAIKKSQKMDRDILIKIHINQEKNKKNLLGDNHTKLLYYHFIPSLCHHITCLQQHYP